MTIHYEFYAGIAYITLNNPTGGNALSQVMLQELTQALQEAHQIPTCRVVVIMATGADFCKGLDLQWAFLTEKSLDLTTIQSYIACLTLMTQLPQPVVMAINGHVTAGGLGVVAAGDLVIATETVRFMLSEVIVGMIPAVVTPFLKRRLSVAQIRYLALSSCELTAVEAQRIGLVDEVVTASLDLALDKQLQRLLRASPEALAATKAYLRRLESQNLAHELALATETLTQWLASPQVVAGIKDFTEGLAPVWFQKYRKRPHG